MVIRVNTSKVYSIKHEPAKYAYVEPRIKESKIFPEKSKNATRMRRKYYNISTKVT